MLQFGISRFNLNKHVIEGVNELAKLVATLFHRPNRIVPFIGNCIRRFREAQGGDRNESFKP